MTSPSTTERDQMLAHLEDGLSGSIVGIRQLRIECTDRFGSIDPFRITRDTAEALTSAFEVQQLALMLSGALHRLAQLPDFNPLGDLADLDFDIGEGDENTPPEGETDNQ